MILIDFTLYFIISYLIGSIPTAFLFGKFLKNVDIRKEGSGNVGASNAFRVLGAKIGALVMAVDILKGFLPVRLAAAGMSGAQHESWLLLIGSAAVLGHMFPVFLKFKGGKGVATTAGVFLAMAPAATGLCIIIWAGLVFVTKIASIGSIAAALALSPAIYYADGGSVFLTSVSALIAVMVIAMHRKNIKNLIAGKELKINQNSSSREEK